LATWRFYPALLGEAMKWFTYIFELVDGGEARSEFNAGDFVRVIAPVPAMDPVSKTGCPQTQVIPPAAALQAISFQARNGQSSGERARCASTHRTLSFAGGPVSAMTMLSARLTTLRLIFE